MNGVAVAVMYGAIALAGNFVHKASMMLLPLPNTVLLLQLVTMYTILKALQRHGILDVPAFHLSKVYQLLPLSLLHCGHSLLVLRALSTLNVPMYNTLKRTTPVMVLTFKAIADARLPDIHTTLSVLVIVSGCIIAGAGDLSFDSAGYSIALLCAFAQALYILLAEHAGPIQHSSSSAHITQRMDAPYLPTRTLFDPSGAQHVSQWLRQVSSVPTLVVGMVTQAFSRRLPPSVRDSDHLYMRGLSEGNVDGDGQESDGGGQERSKRPSQGSGSSLLEDGEAKSGRLAALVSGLSKASAAGVGGSSSSPAEIVHVLCLTGIPLLTVLVLVSGELALIRPLIAVQLTHIGWFTMAMWMLLTASFETLLTGSLILCTHVNSALTTSVVGVLKGLGAVVLGFFIMTKNVPWSAMQVWGILLNTSGGMYYAWLKYQQHQLHRISI